MSGGVVPPQFFEFDLIEERGSPPSRKSGSLLRIVENAFDCPNYKWLEGQIATVGGKAFFVKEVVSEFPILLPSRVGEIIGLHGFFL